MVNALFDKKRRKDLQDAVRKGDLKKAIRKARYEPEADTIPTKVFERAGKTNPASPDPMDRMQQSHVVALDGDKVKATDQALFDAIKDGDIERVRAAIQGGANVNASYPHIPRHRMMDTIISSMMSPLEYARRKGNPKIIELLKMCGAGE